MRHVWLVLIGIVAACAGKAHPALRQWEANTHSDTPWFERERSADVTGDGVPERIVMRAFSTQSDEFEIELSFFVGSEEAYRESWESTYELNPPADVPWGWDAPPAQDVVEGFLQSRLAQILDDVRIQPLDTMLFVKAGPAPDTHPLEDLMDVVGSVTVVDPSQVERLGYDTAETRAIVRDIRRKTPVQVVFGYGYETQLTIAWSARARRFFKLEGCC